MPYNSLATVNPGDVLSSSAWGNVVKANEDYLFSGRPKQVIVLDHNANYSTTSTSFVDIDSSALVITLTVNSGNVLIGFVGTFFGTGVGLTWNLDFLIDGTRYASAGASGLQAADFGFERRIAHLQAPVENLG